MTHAVHRPAKSDLVMHGIKWGASLMQIAGYASTAYGLTPLNIYLFLGGILGWFIVGYMWRDKAIMLIHIVALAAMIAGLISGGTAG